MTPLVVVAAMFLVAFAIPYHAPVLGVFGGLAFMALAIAMVLRRLPAPLGLDFGLDRPVGIALALYATLWLLISTVQLFRRHDDAVTSIA